MTCMLDASFHYFRLLLQPKRLVVGRLQRRQMILMRKMRRRMMMTAQTLILDQKRTKRKRRQVLCHYVSLCSMPCTTDWELVYFRPLLQPRRGVVGHLQRARRQMMA